ncbi:transcription factor bHLH52-like [Wolffia australiana]
MAATVCTHPISHVAALSPEFLLDCLLFDPEPELWPTPLQLPPSFVAGYRPSDGEKKPSEGLQPSDGGVLQTKSAGACLSAQSAAARERRKRISKKTQELGQLIPGAGRMNTAEMLQTAFKYVKFLQAQVGMLELARKVYPTVEIEATAVELQRALMGRAVVQDKLAGEELCLVPARLVMALAQDRAVLSRPSMAGDLLRVLP